MPQLDTAAIEARLAAATPGPLQVSRLANDDGSPFTPEEVSQKLVDYFLKTIEINEGSAYVWFVSTGEKTVCITGNGPTSKANAILQAHAHTDIRALLDEVARRKSVDALIACMANQLTTDEINEDQLVDGDFESAYDTLVKNSRDIWRAINARKALEGGE